MEHTKPSVPRYRAVKIDPDSFTGYNDLNVIGTEDNYTGEFAPFLDEIKVPFFLLEFDDPAAQDALWVYINSCKATNPDLADWLKEQITQAVERSLHDLEYGVYHEQTNSVVPTGSRLAVHAMILKDGGEIVYRSPGETEWTFEVPKIDPRLAPEVVVETSGDDWAMLDEDVTLEVMKIVYVHDSEYGRVCGFHPRLNKWTWNGTMECLRDHEGLEKDPSSLPIKVENFDWEELGEDVTGHTMLHGFTHNGGRECAYHSRLRAWTFEGTKKCLREHSPNFLGFDA